MKTIGILTTAMMAAVVLAASIVGVRSIPDVQRYLRLRSM